MPDTAPNIESAANGADTPCNPVASYRIGIGFRTIESLDNFTHAGRITVR